ncbi:hypothetical protein ACFW9I_27995 [[Kitasatospora] papulosa]
MSHVQLEEQREVWGRELRRQLLQGAGQLTRGPLAQVCLGTSRTRTRG